MCCGRALWLSPLAHTRTHTCSSVSWSYTQSHKATETAIQIDSRVLLCLKRFFWNDYGCCKAKSQSEARRRRLPIRWKKTACAISEMRCQVGNLGYPLRGPDPSGYRPFSAFLSCSFGSTNGSRDIVESIGWLLLKPKQNGDAKQVKIVWTLVVQACKDLHCANAEWCWTFGSFAPLVSDSFTSPILHVDDPCKTLRTQTTESYLKTWALQFQIGIKHDLSPAHSNMLQCSCNKNKLTQYWLSKRPFFRQLTTSSHLKHWTCAYVLCI